MINFITYTCLISTAFSQVIPADEELSLSLKPPPLPSSSSLQKADFSNVQFISDTPIETSPPVVQQQQPKNLAHQAVLFSSELESKLAPELQNPFYKDPRIAEILARHSWFTTGEKHVTDRETEKIPRDKIYYALKSAGLVRKRRNVYN